MSFEKYKNLLIKKIKDQISEWFESNSVQLIPNEEVHRFLHSIKGTSGTIQLGGLLQITSELLDKIETNEKNSWEKDELRDFLYHLIGVSYEYENFEEIESKPHQPREGNIPLIQVIDDDVSMLILLKDALEENGWMVIANTEPEKAIDQYFELNPDCLIIDVNLPYKNGFQILEAIQMHNKQKFIPKIMISIDQSRDTRLNAYKKGADDFITKPIDIEEFIIRVERQLYRKQIFDQSVLLDELTQVYNRRFLNEVYEKSLKELFRTKNPFTIALLDLDHFKAINDQYGHLMGDMVLMKFAQFLKENIRSSDYVFRYGGEEFVLLFTNCNDSDTIDSLTRLLNRFSEIEFISGTTTFHVKFSGGVFVVNDPNISMSTALKSADEALYKAKEEGRARVISSNSVVPGLVKHKLYVSIVDDDAIIRTMLVKVLQTMKFDHMELDIKAFEDGLKFFESSRHEEQGEHFLILDGVMPVMDGIEILQKVKQGKNKDRTNVLMLTARKSENDIARALKLGADDYVTKPFSMTELQARIQRLIQRM
ncbi:diguanylate cyclase [Bacillus sp. CGMCC 1.16607]|uniref:GGDEF domain-containing response regulator n=1 Tax=Bacillus sp. CGMCC 1.16607 TaxID=3351842 RepID=UPI0036300A23